MTGFYFLFNITKFLTLEIAPRIADCYEKGPHWKKGIQAIYMTQIVLFPK